MCDLNGPFRLCSCSSDIDYTKPHWILRINSKNERIDASVMIGMMTPLNLIDKIERRKILRRLNTINVFEFCEENPGMYLMSFVLGKNSEDITDEFEKMKTHRDEINKDYI